MGLLRTFVFGWVVGAGVLYLVYRCGLYVAG